MLKFEYWGQGYGTKVLELLEVKARESGTTVMKATMDRNNIATVRLLMKSGYHQQKSGWTTRLSDDGEALDEGREILLFAKKI